jgi:hypothetical protein
MCFASLKTQQQKHHLVHYMQSLSLRLRLSYEKKTHTTSEKVNIFIKLCGKSQKSGCGCGEEEKEKIDMRNVACCRRTCSMEQKLCYI